MEILKYHSRNKPLENETILSSVAEVTQVRIGRRRGRGMACRSIETGADRGTGESRFKGGRGHPPGEKGMMAGQSIAAPPWSGLGWVLVAAEFQYLPL
jgi:hypothetical protein